MGFHRPHVPFEFPKHFMNHYPLGKETKFTPKEKSEKTSNKSLVITVCIPVILV